MVRAALLTCLFSVAALLSAVLLPGPLGHTPAYAGSPSVQSWDFEGTVPDAWSEDDTFEIGGSQTLGLFNSRNRQFKDDVELKLTGLEPSAYRLRFDLMLVGSWDSEGELADSFAVHCGKREILFVDHFPCQIEGSNEEKPIGNTGTVKVPVSTRTLGYWVMPLDVEIPADCLHNGELELTFAGETSARRVEFWALDNVRLEQIK